MGLKPKKAAALTAEAPEFPFALDYLWLMFGEFSQGLAPNGMGPVMAAWRDVQAFDQALDLSLEPWEKKTLIRLATLRAVIQSEPQAPKPDGAQNKNR
jgi:hypothetical protein